MDYFNITEDSLKFKQEDVKVVFRVKDDSIFVTGVTSILGAANLGGEGLYTSVNNRLIQLKGLQAGSHITLTPTSTGITISSTGGIEGNFVSASTFNNYTASTKIVLDGKLDSSLFNVFTGTTAPNTYLKKSDFSPYSASTLININSRLLTSSFNIYSGLTNTLINSKINSSIFNLYTGTTAPNTYQTKSSIAVLTGTTLPATYQSKSSISVYTGTTAPNQFASKSNFNLFTGTTAPNTYQTKSSIATLTGATLPATYQTKTSIAALTGTTLPATYQTKSSIATLTGTTLPSTYASKSNFNLFTGTTAPNKYALKTNSAINGFLNLTGTGATPSLKIIGAGTSTNYSLKSFQSDGTTEILSLLDNGLFTSTPLVTASAGVGRGDYIKPTLTAAANNDVLAAVDISPTFSSGALTGITKYSIRTIAGAHLYQMSNVTATTTTNSLYLQNPTLASAIVQQFSPSIILEGQGFKNGGTPASQTVRFAVDAQTVLGVNNPTGNFRIQQSINNAALSTIASFSNQGTLAVTSVLGQLSYNFASINSTSGFGKNNSSQGIMTVLSNASDGFGISGSIGSTILAKLDVRASTVSTTTGFGAIRIQDAPNIALTNETIKNSFVGSTGNTYQATTVSNQRFTYFSKQGLSNNTAGIVSTVTRAVGLAVQGAPIAIGTSTGLTLTNTIGVEIEGVNVGSRTTNSYGLVVNTNSGATNNYAGYFNGGNVGINTTAPTALLDIGASTTSRASLRIRSGTAPTSPNDGDIWYDGTDLKIRIGGTTKTITLT